MVNIPSKRKSDKLRLICAELNLCDPYRIFHPIRREYTFIPSAIGMLNRSRLDFFVISEGIVNKISNCTIPHSLTSTVFDHKPIFMSTNSKKFPNKQQINDVILDDPDLLYHIKISVFDSYIYHCLDFRLELIQDRPSSINQSLNRGTKPRHTHTAQFTLVMGFIRYAPYPQTTPNDWTIETVYTFYLQKLTTTDEWENIQPALFPHDAHGRVRVEASCRHLLVAVRVLSDLNLHNECMFK